MSRTFQCSLGGKPLVIEIGKFAEQANAAVVVQSGGTVVLATVCRSESPREEEDFLPLTVDYEERLYAAGKIPGSFFRREGRPGQDAILAARLTDRPLRPLFPKGFRHEVQIIVTVLSVDQENEPDILSIIGGSCALTLSDIPFNGPIGAVRVGYINGEWIINPTFAQREESLLNVVVAATKNAVVMLEAGAKEASEQLIMEAIKRGYEAAQELIRLQEEIQESFGKPKLSFQPPVLDPELEAAVASLLQGRLDLALLEKSKRETFISQAKEELEHTLGDRFPEPRIQAAINEFIKKEFRRTVLERRARLDGRRLDELRPISAEVGLLPRTHGSALFTRGQTQVLTITTLGSLDEMQFLDGLTPQERKRFIHHYNFPPFSTGEVKRIGSPSRREIGHGALVERALSVVLPSEQDFPYTIRLVSEVLSSNGSTSMASTCASSLSLMDAGVPIKEPVAGVAMGLITDGDGKYAIITDIAGLEDAYGDMDFKVAGTVNGITALQLDIKIQGVSFEILEKALEQARQARWQILERMREVLPASRPQVSPYAPKMYRITIDPDKIGYVIGFGGKTIKSVMEETKTTIDIENDGTVIIGATSEEMALKAIQKIESLTRKLETGQIYTGKVTRLLPQGAMVEIYAGKEGLVPLRELAEYPVRRADEVVKVGDEIMVKVIEVDRQGRVTLSRRAVFEGFSKTGARVRDSLQEKRRFSHERKPRFPPREGH